MAYPTYPLKSAIGYHVKVGEGFESEAIVMQRQVERLRGKVDMKETVTRYKEIIRNSMKKARQHRAWANELRILLGD
jgi:hypothetical protein